MDEFFKDLLERAQYYERFEIFRNECQKDPSGTEHELVSIEGK